MITLDQWRARIGGYRCRGVKEEEEPSDYLYRQINKAPPVYSNLYRKNYDENRSERHGSVIKVELIRGGVEQNPGPGPSPKLVSTLLTIV